MEEFKQFIQLVSNNRNYMPCDDYCSDDEDDDTFEISLDLAEIIEYKDLVALSIYYTKFTINKELEKSIYFNYEHNAYTMAWPRPGTKAKTTQNPEIVCLLWLLLSDENTNGLIGINPIYNTGKPVLNPEYIQNCWDYLLEYNISLLLLGDVIRSIKSQYEEDSPGQFIKYYLGSDVKSARSTEMLKLEHT